MEKAGEEDEDEQDDGGRENRSSLTHARGAGACGPELPFVIDLVSRLWSALGPKPLAPRQPFDAIPIDPVLVHVIPRSSPLHCSCAIPCRLLAGARPRCCRAPSQFSLSLSLTPSLPPSTT